MFLYGGQSPVFHAGHEQSKVASEQQIFQTVLISYRMILPQSENSVGILITTVYSIVVLSYCADIGIVNINVTFTCAMTGYNVACTCTCAVDIRVKDTLEPVYISFVALFRGGT